MSKNVTSKVLLGRATSTNSKVSTESTSLLRVDSKISEGQSKLLCTDIDDESMLVEEKSEEKVVKTTISSLGIKLPNMTVRLVYGANSTSSSNTALTGAFNVLPSSSSEFSSLATLYQECKVLGGRVKFQLAVSATASILPEVYGCITYDPLNNAALSSVAKGLMHGTHKLFSFNTGLVAPISQVNDGFWEMPFKVPTGTQISTTDGSSVVTGSWSDTRDTDIYGYLNYYVQPAGTGLTTTLTAFIMLDVAFRSRI